MHGRRKVTKTERIRIRVDRFVLNRAQWFLAMGQRFSFRARRLIIAACLASKLAASGPADVCAKIHSISSRFDTQPAVSAPLVSLFATMR